jgi:tetratricopeptide (TPR) repeat protein
MPPATPISQETVVSRSTKSPATPLPNRIARARSEGRTQQALELARQLYKQARSPEHQELLRQVLVERGTQLQQQGHTRDAATVFANALEFGGTAEFRAQVAELLAASGNVARAMQALGPDGDAVVRQRMLGHLADGALRQGAAGCNTLPAELHAGFDAIVQAFAHGAAGRDDEARAALQAIGLQSPFLEWKLLLRGLLAYYVRDDARALENWQRLDPRRVPARLAAPLRLGIDRGYRDAQPAATQNTLKQQAARLAGQAAGGTLDGLRTALADQRSLANAFRIAEQVLPDLRRDRPALVPRLAHCFFWAIVDRGHPEDMDRYRRTFGPLATPVEVARLEALCVEHREMVHDAHEAWQDVARALAQSPQEWPGEVGKRAQALVWAHLANHAAEYEREAPKEIPFLYRDHFEKPAPLKPSAAECLERSIALAPERLEGYLALFHLHRRVGQIAKARKVGQELLQRFPNHAAISEALGDLFLETQEPDKAREYFEKALSANPLERRLRGKLAHARRNLGLALTLDKKFAAARTEYEAALSLAEGAAGPVLCQWAVLEIKAGADERAAELVARALQAPGQRLAVRYGLVSESIRAKLVPAQKKRIAGEMTQALAQPSSPAEVLALLEAAAQQRQRQLDTFRGQKTHEKTFLRFLDRIPLDTFGEDELVQLCGYLQAIDARGPWQRCLDKGDFEHPDNPALALSRIDYHLTQGKHPNPWMVKHHLDRARKILQELPREAQERYLPVFRQREQKVNALGGGLPPMRMLDRLFDEFGGFDPDDDDEEW